MVNYFQIEFGYTGSIVNIVSDNDATAKASIDLQLAIDIVKATLDKIKVDHLHAYAWPDGSLYRYIRTELSERELRDKLSEELDSSLSIGGVATQLPTANPHKENCATLEEYFARNAPTEGVSE